MYNGADLKPVLDKSGQRLPGAFTLPDGRLVMRRRILVEGRIVSKTWDAYARLDDSGEVVGLFEFPVENDSEARTVSRKVTGGASDLESDLYLQKTVLKADGTARPVFRYATASDAIKLRDLAEKNSSIDMARRQALDPGNQQAAFAKAIADAITDNGNKQRPARQQGM